MSKKLTQEHLKSIIHYDKKTGIFKKIKCRRGDWVGRAAGTIGKKGYRHISIDNKQYLAHHLAWLYVKGYMPKQLDHKNNIKDDNRFCNLRLATFSENMHNQGKRKHNTSGYKGVCFHKAAQKWTACIKVNWKCIYLGLYTSPEAAHAAYCKAAVKYHGEFARFV